MRSPATSTAISSFSCKCRASTTDAGNVTVVEFPTLRSFTICMQFSFSYASVYTKVYTLDRIVSRKNGYLRYFSSQRDVPMLLRRVRIPFILQHLQRGNQLCACITWFNHFVDISSTGSDIG